MSGGGGGGGFLTVVSWLRKVIFSREGNEPGLGPLLSHRPGSRGGKKTHGWTAAFCSFLSPRESPRNTLGASVALLGSHCPVMRQEGGGLMVRLRSRDVLEVLDSRKWLSL